MLTCPRCGGDLSPDADVCEHCGHRLDDGGAAGAVLPAAGKPLSVRRLVGGLGCGFLTVLLALLAIVILFGLLLGGLVGAAEAGA